MIANIDADLIIFNAGFAAERTRYTLRTPDNTDVQFDNKRAATKFIKENDINNYELHPLAIVEPVENCLNIVKNMIASIIEDTASNKYQLYFSCPSKDNFRYKIASYYKANRDRDRRPHHEGAIREYCIRHHGAIVAEGEEADDALGINQDENTICCSLDKDLDMIEGWHYKWEYRGKPSKKYYIDAVQAWQCFYCQLLSGDSSDNIPGLSRLAGKVASASRLNPLYSLSNPKEMEQYVLDTYEMFDVPEEQVEEVGKLLWIRREGGQIWQLGMHK